MGSSTPRTTLGWANPLTIVRGAASDGGLECFVDCNGMLFANAQFILDVLARDASKRPAASGTGRLRDAAEMGGRRCSTCVRYKHGC